MIFQISPESQYSYCIAIHFMWLPCRTRQSYRGFGGLSHLNLLTTWCVNIACNCTIICRRLWNRYHGDPISSPNIVPLDPLWADTAHQCIVRLHMSLFGAKYPSILARKPLQCSRTDDRTKYLSRHVTLLVVHRVILVVGFAFLAKNFGTWQGAMNGTLSFYESGFSSGDSETSSSYIHAACTLTNHLVKLSLPNI